MNQTSISMKTDDIKKQIRDFLITNFLFGSTAKNFTDTDSFMEKGIIDSTGILELAEFVEKVYEIKVNDNEFLPENLDSLDNIAGFILRKKGE